MKVEILNHYTHVWRRTVAADWVLSAGGTNMIIVFELDNFQRACGKGGGVVVSKRWSGCEWLSTSLPRAHSFSYSGVLPEAGYSQRRLRQAFSQVYKFSVDALQTRRFRNHECASMHGSSARARSRQRNHRHFWSSWSRSDEFKSPTLPESPILHSLKCSRKHEMIISVDILHHRRRRDIDRTKQTSMLFVSKLGRCEAVGTENSPCQSGAWE